MLNISDVSSFHHEYNAMACAIEIVNDVDAAINHIHKHGRHVDVNHSCLRLQVNSYKGEG